MASEEQQSWACGVTVKRIRDGDYTWTIAHPCAAELDSMKSACDTARAVDDHLRTLFPHK